MFKFQSSNNNNNNSNEGKVENVYVNIKTDRNYQLLTLTFLSVFILTYTNIFNAENVNCIYLNNLEIEEVKEFENNKYREYFLKVKLIKIKEVL